MENIRKPAFAGLFYPKEKAILKRTIQKFLVNAKTITKISEEKIKAIVVPHAGYVYSGQTAAYAYQFLKNKKRVDHLILIGCSHFLTLPGAVQDDCSFWQTPLGKVPVKQFKKQSPLVSDSLPHKDEHCLEVQLPYLQSILQNFSITPILISDLDHEIALAKVLIPSLNQNSFLIISSDLSHYHPESTAIKIDEKTIELILNLDTAELKKEAYEACGKIAILTALEIAKKFSWKPVLLHYDTSANYSRNSANVVGYGSFVFYSRFKTRF